MKSVMHGALALLMVGVGFTQAHAAADIPLEAASWETFAGTGSVTNVTETVPGLGALSVLQSQTALGTQYGFVQRNYRTLRYYGRYVQVTLKGGGSFAIYVRVTGTNGVDYYLNYTSKLQPIVNSGTGYLNYTLAADYPARYGAFETYTLDLERDLARLVPGAGAASIRWFAVRGAVNIASLRVLDTFDYLAADTDGDLLTGATEDALGTSPFLADSDGDGLRDGIESGAACADPLVYGVPGAAAGLDADGDGVPTRTEIYMRSDCNVKDSGRLPSFGWRTYAQAPGAAVTSGTEGEVVLSHSGELAFELGVMNPDYNGPFRLPDHLQVSRARIQYGLKTDEDAVLFVRVLATNGQSYFLTYQTSAGTPSFGSGYVNVYLGSEGYSFSGAAYTKVVRNLNADLAAWVPGASVSKVLWVALRGRVSLKDVQFVGPIVSSITPQPATPGATVVITGNYFGASQGTSAVVIGGQTAAVTNWADTSIEVTVPSLSAGMHDVKVVVAGQASNTAMLMTEPQVSSVSPAGGSGGDPVIISGTGFGTGAGNRVEIGGAEATVSSWTDTEIRVVVPAAAAPGTQSLIMYFDGAPAAGETFAVTPRISGLGAVSVTGGDTLQINGTNFGALQGESAVSIGGMTATVVSWSGTFIEAMVPVGVAAGSHNLLVNIGGSSTVTLSSADVPKPITDLATASSSLSSGVSGTLTSVSIAVDISHGWIGDLTVRLRHPDGTGVLLHDQSGDSLQDIITTYAALTMPAEPLAVLNAKPAAGTWALEISDGAEGDTGTLNAWSLELTTSGLSTNAFALVIHPSITALSAASGSGGAAVTLTGSNFGTTQGTSSVSIGGAPAVVTGWQDTSITVLVPDNVIAGEQDVTVTVGGQGSNAAPFTVLPRISLISPVSGSGGTVVTLTGSNFGPSQGTSTVTPFTKGGATVTSWSHTSITLVVPDIVAAGALSVFVRVNALASNAVFFTVNPYLTSLSVGAAPDGTPITLTGKNFGSTQGSSTVLFGLANAAISSWSNTSIVAVVPAGAGSGNQDVTVRVAGQTSNGLPFTVPPAISGVAPSLVQAGDQIEIVGSRFEALEAGNAVTIGGESASIVSWSDDVIRALVPAGAAAGSSQVVVWVDGAASTPATITIRPVVTEAAPNPVTSGATLIVTGGGFGPGPGGAISLAGTPLDVLAWSPTAITAQVAASIDAGTHALLVEVNGQAAASISVFVEPRLDSLSAGALSVTGNTEVAVAGSGFGASQGSGLVKVAYLAATIIAWSPTEIRFLAPASITSNTHSIEVTVNGQASNLLPLKIRPSIYSVTPNPAVASETVTITGANFGAFGDGELVTEPLVGMNWLSWSMHTIEFAVNPDARSESAWLSVVSLYGFPSDGFGFSVEPNVTYVSRLMGSANDFVLVSGTSFWAGSGNCLITLSVGSTPLSNFLCEPNRNNAGGTIPAEAVAGTQTLSAGAYGSFAFTVVPKISQVTPPSGTAGDLITLTGYHFAGDVTVSVGGAAATIESSAAGSLSFRVPAGLSGVRDVIVTVNDTPSAPSAFTVPATITAVAPQIGTGGDLVSLTGSGFGASQGTSTLTLGGVTINAITWADNQVQFEIPDDVTAGTRDLALAIEGVWAAPVTLSVEPTITGISPSGGSSGNIVISGTNFGAEQGKSCIRAGFDSISASAWAHTSITASLPESIMGGAQSIEVGVGECPLVYSSTEVPKPISQSGLTPYSNIAIFADPVTITQVNFALKLRHTQLVNLEILARNPIGIGRFLRYRQGGGTFIDTIYPKLTAPYSSLDSFNTNQLNGYWRLEINNTGGTGFGKLITWGMEVFTTATGFQASNGWPYRVKPAMDSISNSSGSGGDSITVTGSHFGPESVAGYPWGNNKLELGGTAVVTSAWSDTSAVFLIPGDVPAGVHDLVLYAGGETSNAISVTVLPAIDAISPDPAAGSTVAVSGRNFGPSQGLSSVTIGGSPVSVSSWSSSAITFSIPATTPAGTHEVVVSVAGQASNGYVITVHPDISAVSPLTGTGGDAVTLTGAGFGGTQGASTLTFGGFPLAVSLWSDTSLQFLVPDDAVAGENEIVVTVGGQAGGPVTFTVQPSISAVSAAGDGITVAGHNFGDAPGSGCLRLGDNTLATSTWEPTSVSAPIPDAVTAGSYSVSVDVGDCRGAVTATWPSYDLLPRIDGLSTNVALAGSTVLLSGAHFGAVQGGSVVSVGSLPAEVTAWNASAVEFSIPATITAGTHSVAVSVGGQTGNAVTLAVLPQVFSLQPGSGSGGTGVSVIGSGFGETSAGNSITLGGYAATITGWTPTWVGFVVPSSAEPGSLDVVVSVNALGTSPLAFTVVPSLTGATPASATGGDTVTLAGTNFGASQGGSTVTIGGTEAVVVSWSSTSIAIEVAAGLRAGTHSVAIHAGGEDSNAQDVTIDPSIVALNPVTAVAGTRIVISGTNFGPLQEDSTVTFDSLAADVVSWSALAVEVEVPAGTPLGSIPVQLTVAGLASNTVVFTRIEPVILARSPSAGTTGTLITFTGRFGPNQGQVTVGGVTASIAAWATDTVQAIVTAGTPKGMQPAIVYDAGGVPSNVVPFIQRGANVWIPLEDVPEPRSWHAAVWTGSEMVVWGGSGRTGGRYNPATDSWIPMPYDDAAQNGSGQSAAVWTGRRLIVWGGDEAYGNIGAQYDPATAAWSPVTTAGIQPRNGHAAVWTGSRMIIWGGRYYAGPPTFEVRVNSGGSYDPITDSWQATSLIGAPTGREAHTAVWTGDSMIVFGGYDGAALLNSGGQYYPQADTWGTTANVGAPYAALHSAVWTGDRMIVWGGVNETFAATNAGASYYPLGNTWQAISAGANVPASRFAHVAVWTGDRMIVWGGCDMLSMSGGDCGGSMLGTGGVYEVATDSWSGTTLADAPAPRMAGVAVWTGSEVIVWGGKGLGSDLNSGGRYNPLTNSWIPTASTPNMPAARTGHTAVWSGTQVLVWGGRTAAGMANDGARYTPATNDWLPIATTGAPAAVSGHTAVWANARLVVWGGYDGASVSGAGAKYDPATDGWSPLPATGAPSPRVGHVMVTDGFNFAVWGGVEASGAVTNSGALFDEAQSLWAATPVTAGTPAARRNHSLVWTGNELVAWGGGEPGTPLNSGGRFNPITGLWTPTSVGANVPTGLSGHVAVWTGSEMIVWGGTVAGDGGRYNPISDTWVRISYDAWAFGRSQAAVWTGSRMLVWGGVPLSCMSCYSNSLFAYDPGAGTWSGGNAAPVFGREGHVAVWTGEEMFVWGGYTTWNGRESLLATGARYLP